MIIATYNVNSINARLDNLLEWLNKNQPDVILLQEIKTEFNDFPFFELQAAGYEAKILGQKSYNGVAILSRQKIKIREEGLPDFEDENARYLEAEIEIGKQKYVVASIYLPNGNPPYNNPDDDTKYVYKLKWMEALYNHARKLLDLRLPVILGGDFNVIMTEHDVYSPDEYRGNALFRKEVKQRLAALMYLGFYDAFRCLHPNEAGYTFWDYAGAALQNDLGMRIDYLLLSPDAADRLNNCEVDKSPRLGIKPSDHTILKAELE
ncbi:MAG: exodeoxyribonuclease III [Alphaproteobacteria bacterium]|nr:exodeoxyribonuclease III [Alphaproteobacteria bacterium]MBQ7285217.1 exodeoxyribonuclease III [Alphaproteobacteria bacterium]